jgi:LemA protein
MGANLWLSGILAACLFWCVGVYNRITRLRARSLESFAAVAINMYRYRTLVLEHIHPCKVTETPAAFQQLLLQLDQLDQTTKEAQACPWDKTTLMALTTAGAEVSSVWGVLRSAPADLAGAALPDNLLQDWDTNSRALQHAVGGFNQILADYNEAITQFPATVITSFLGFKPAGQIAIFNEA